MRDVRRLLDKTVLARTGARALVGVGLGLVVHPLVALLLGLALGSTAIVGRAAVLRVRDRDGEPEAAARSAALGVALLLELTLLQLRLLDPSRAVRLEGQVTAVQGLIAELGRLDAVGWSRLGLAVMAATVLLGAPAGALALADLADLGGSSAAPAPSRLSTFSLLLDWIGRASLLLGVVAGLYTLTHVGELRGWLDAGLVASFLGPAGAAAAFSGLGLVVAALFLLDVVADTLVRIDWSFAP